MRYMSDVEIFCIPDCAACSAIISKYEADGHDVKVFHVLEDKEATALAEYRGIMNDRFPVVYVDGIKQVMQ